MDLNDVGLGLVSGVVSGMADWAGFFQGLNTRYLTR